MKRFLIDVNEFKEEMEHLKGCGCWHKKLGEATKVYYYLPSVNDGDVGGAVFRTPEGFFGFEESQDYTGHGCQCGSNLEGPFNTLEDAIAVGIGKELRIRFGLEKGAM